MPYNDSPAVTKPYRVRDDAHDAELSAIRAAQAVLTACDILPRHRNELLSIAVWKYTEAAEGKLGLRYRTQAVNDPERVLVEHEHVRPRSAIVADLLIAGPALAPLVLATAVGCLVTKDEHKRLTTVKDSGDLYEAAGIATVIDRRTGRLVPSSDMERDVPNLDVVRHLIPGGGSRICILLAARLNERAPDVKWALLSAARDSASVEGEWIYTRLDGLSDQHDQLDMDEIKAVYVLASRVFDSNPLTALAELLSSGAWDGVESGELLAGLVACAGPASPGTPGQADHVLDEVLNELRQASDPNWDAVTERFDHTLRAVAEVLDATTAQTWLSRHFRSSVLTVSLGLLILRQRGALESPLPLEILNWLEAHLALFRPVGTTPAS